MVGVLGRSAGISTQIRLLSKLRHTLTGNWLLLKSEILLGGFSLDLSNTEYSVFIATSGTVRREAHHLKTLGSTKRFRE
jgi:hypothetical protein